jgi:hypothetical protein
MDNHHSDLKDLIQESKSSLMELEEHLQKAEMWLEENAAMQSQGQEDLCECVSSLSNALEKLRRKMSSAPASNSIREIHHQIEETCGRALQSFNQIEAQYRKQIELDRLKEGFRIDEEETTGSSLEKPAQSSLRTLLDSARKYLAEEKYEQCKQLLHSLLQIVPEEPEALKLLRDAERRWEDQRMAEEMAIHVDNVKREAMNLFDQEKYLECLGKFEFLCEVEPGNTLYQNYLNLSREEIHRLSNLPAGEISDSNNAVGQPNEELDSPHITPNLDLVDDDSFSCPADIILPLKETPGLTAGANESDSADDSTHLFPRFGDDRSSIAFTPVPADTETEHDIGDSRMECSDKKAEDSTTVDLSALGTPNPSENLREEGAEEEIIRLEGQKDPPEDQISAEEKKKKDLFFLAMAATILILLFPVWLTWHWAKNRKEISTLESSIPLVVNTLPPGAAVFLDGRMVGNSDLQLSQVPVGKHSIRLELAGYNISAQEFDLQPGHNNRLSIQLTTIPSPVAAKEEDVQTAAESLLEQHKYAEAFQKSAMILKDDPENENARQIRAQVRSHYLLIGDQALKANKWEEARKSFEVLTRLFPQETAAAERLKYVKGKILEQQAASAAETTRKARLQELEESLKQALKSGNYMPPRPGNALAQARQIQALDSASTAAFEALNTIRQELSTQAQQRISQHDFERARMVIAQLQTFFAASPDISQLNSLCRAEELKQKNLLNDCQQKIDSAMSAGHFVTPPQDNAILYCNRLLSQGGAKVKVGALKQEAFIKAVSQARNLIASEKFENAHDILIAIQAFSQYEEGIPLPAEEIKTELSRLEFYDWPVIHDHALGSCSGKLQFNGYVISYLPRGDSKDGFHMKISEIKQSRTGQRLKVEFRNKTYHFQMVQTASWKTPDEELSALSQTMKNLLADEKK